MALLRAGRPIWKLPTPTLEGGGPNGSREIFLFRKKIKAGKYFQSMQWETPLIYTLGVHFKISCRRLQLKYSVETPLKTEGEATQNVSWEDPLKIQWEATLSMLCGRPPYNILWEATSEHAVRELPSVFSRASNYDVESPLNVCRWSSFKMRCRNPLQNTMWKASSKFAVGVPLKIHCEKSLQNMLWDAASKYTLEPPSKVRCGRPFQNALWQQTPSK